MSDDIVAAMLNLRDEYPTLDDYLDSYGESGLEEAVELARRFADGEITWRGMGEELGVDSDVSYRLLEIILTESDISVNPKSTSGSEISEAEAAEFIESAREQRLIRGILEILDEADEPLSQVEVAENLRSNQNAEEVESKLAGMSDYGIVAMVDDGWVSLLSSTHRSTPLLTDQRRYEYLMVGARPRNLRVLRELAKFPDGTTMSNLDDYLDEIATEDAVDALSEEGLVSRWSLSAGSHVELSGHGLLVLNTVGRMVQMEIESNEHFYD